MILVTIEVYPALSYCDFLNIVKYLNPENVESRRALYVVKMAIGINTILEIQAPKIGCIFPVAVSLSPIMLRIMKSMKNNMDVNRG